jgi:PleD family two-component response regulator
MTVSVGRVLGPVEGASVEAPLQGADRALMEAKGQGRDRRVRGFARLSANLLG